MSKHVKSPTHAARPAALLGAMAAALACLALLGASSASAAFEGVGHFAGKAGELHKESSSEWPEEVQLGGLGGMAVNYTGAGGVPAGTVYVATDQYPSAHIARYNPDGSFSERWTFKGHPEPEERCGPEGAAAHPVCKSQPGGNTNNTVDVDVDQTTGYVYVFGGENAQSSGEKIIHAYTPDGSEVIAEFGEAEPYQGKSTAESPEKLHALVSAELGALAVNSAGDVYVYDINRSSHSINGSGEVSEYHRLMEFEPESPGDYEHYVYAGQSHDVQAGFEGESKLPSMPVADAAGNLYVSEFEGGYVQKLDPHQPGAAPLCEFKVPGSGVYSLTVNPLTGEAFFFSEKNRRIHQLSAGCNGEGKFTETSSFAISPNRSYITGMALDPARVFSAGRPAGVLYAGSPDSEGGLTEGSYPETLVESALGYIFAQPPEIPPTVEAETVAHVTPTTATLSATVNPKGSTTRYVFQYETESAYEENEPSERFAGAMESPLGGAFAGEENKAVTVSASLAGLSPATAYRFRAVATSHCSEPEPEKLCETAGEAVAFRSFSLQAPGLPDQRAYELVSPVEKGGGEVIPAEPLNSSCPFGTPCKPGNKYEDFPMQAAPDGNSVVYEGSAFDSEHAALLANQYIARRTSSGWQTTNLTPTHLGSSGRQGYKAFATDLGKGVLRQASPELSPEAPAGYQDIYAQPSGNPPALTPLLTEGQAFNRPASEFELEYAGASADLSRIFFRANDALSEGTAFAPAAVDGGKEKDNLYEWHEGGISLVNVMPGNSETQPGASFGAPSTHPISEDGARAFFSDEAGQVYVREGGEATREIETEGVPDPGEFLVAAKDGSAVLLANGHLHYLDEEGEPTEDLTQGKGGFQGVVGESEELTHVYFVDTEVLDEAPNERGEGAEEGKNNLYAWGQGEGTRFVARLSTKDNPQFGGGDWKPPYERTAEASPNGRYLAFLSVAPLSGYDSTGPCEEISGTNVFKQVPCQEAFLYDSATGKLLCASCNPSGERPLGRTFLRLPSLQGRETQLQPRYLTDQGRLFFDSRDSIVPADSNAGVEDVYQWEPSGVGDCESQFAEGGCVRLISAGTGTADSNFVTMDPSGQNVFFTTRDQLALKDRDDLYDLYDARVEGGIGAETEISRAECQGEACQPPVSAPNDATPSSSSFEGPGNPREAKAKKHKKKRHKKKHSRHAHKHGKKHGRQKRHGKRAAKPNHGGAK